MASILIVEDDLTYATMMQTWLRKKGFTVERASSVSAAARAVTDGTGFDLILSDLRLPDHDGLFLLNWLRKKNMQMPFIVMTSYAEVQNAVLAMKSGACDYIAKPVQPDILLMDEPTSALDPVSTLVVEQLACELKETCTLVVVTHNMQQAARISDSVAFFLLGELVEHAPTAQLFKNPTDPRTADYLTGRFG